MTEISQAQRTAEWLCRILITLDLYLVVAAYLSFFQAKHQLITPLIPSSILYEVVDIYMKAGMVTSIGFLAGLGSIFSEKGLLL